MKSLLETISDKRKVEIGRVIHRCNSLSDDIYMIFYLKSERGFGTRRYTRNNPDKMLEFLVVTRGDETAEALYTNWIIKEAHSPFNTGYQHNLIIISESEFVEEFGELDTFKERILSSIVVYDHDAQFVLQLNSLEHSGHIEEFNVNL